MAKITLKSLDERIEKLDTWKYDEYNHDILDHFKGCLFLIGITVIITLIIVGFILAGINSSPKVEVPKPYYADAHTFCEHFNMTLDSNEYIFNYDCLEYKNDTAIYHMIEQVNNRWVFRQ